MHETIQPNSYIALRLPSDSLKVLYIEPNTTISLGKHGSFHANHILGRPYHLTFEILDEVDGPDKQNLRVVPAVEIYSDLVEEEVPVSSEEEDDNALDVKNGVEYKATSEGGEVVMRTNQHTLDDASSQRLSMDEIEALKKEGSGSGKDLVAKILESHSALDQKTAFALAKYTLRKARKYMKRFSVLPLDVPLLTRWMMTEKEPMKIMEMREEMLALIVCWANVHYGSYSRLTFQDNGVGQIGGGRWLAVDETGGLLVAAMAEKMGILYSSEADPKPHSVATPHLQQTESIDPNSHKPISCNSAETQNPQSDLITGMSAITNTITVLHAASEPNLSLLSYFNFIPSTPSPLHPLFMHLKTLSWLQLLDPTADTSYTEPAIFDDAEIRTWKSSKRANYYRKRRRWARIKAVVDSTRAGGFDGLVVSSVMDLKSIMQHTVPLLRGAAQIVIYSPNIEPLVELMDCYSTARRTSFLSLFNPISIKDPDIAQSVKESFVPSEDFPLDPTLLLAPTIQTVRARQWQVLPGRTHPLMTGRGGAEGYIFTATRVLRAEGKIEARGKGFKRRKMVDGNEEPRKVSVDIASQTEDL